MNYQAIRNGRHAFFEQYVDFLSSGAVNLYYDADSFWVLKAFKNGFPAQVKSVGVLKFYLGFLHSIINFESLLNHLNSFRWQM